MTWDPTQDLLKHSLPSAHLHQLLSSPDEQCLKYGHCSLGTAEWLRAGRLSQGKGLWWHEPQPQAAPPLHRELWVISHCTMLHPCLSVLELLGHKISRQLLLGEGFWVIYDVSTSSQWLPHSWLLSQVYTMRMKGETEQNCLETNCAKSWWGWFTAKCLALGRNTWFYLPTQSHHALPVRSLAGRRRLFQLGGSMGGRQTIWTTIVLWLLMWKLYIAIYIILFIYDYIYY